MFEAWTKPELIKQWWVPKSFGISFISWSRCSYGGHVPFRVLATLLWNSLWHSSAGGGGRPPPPPPPPPPPSEKRETPPPPRARARARARAPGWSRYHGTVTFFEEMGDQTLLVLHELYPQSKPGRAIASGSTGTSAASSKQELDTLATLVRS